MTAVGDTQLQPTSSRSGAWFGLCQPVPAAGDAGQGNEILRRLVQQADAQRGAPGNLASVWPQIRRGEVVITDTFCSPLRHFVVLASSRVARPVSLLDCSLLERVLLSDAQKQTAMDCGLPPSTLSMHAQRALKAIGASFAPSKAPLVFAFLVSASEREQAHVARFCRVISEAAEYCVISLARPELRLASVLTLAEYQVLCRLVEGWSYGQIAFERGTSVRTVANQVASVFRRLQVSGRNQLLSFLVAANAEPPAASSAAM